MGDSLEYNTKRSKLVIPEYGRHIQRMVDQLLNSKNREDRNKIAKAIIGVMGNLNPHLRDVTDFQHKLWDQLYIMSDFKLDVDSPYEKPSKNILEEKPDKLLYPQTNPKYRFYGNNITRMINVAKDWEEGQLKDALVYTIANHMKKCFLNWNKDTVEDNLIFEHLDELSEGKLKINSELLPLTESSEFLKARSKNGNGPKSNSKHRKRNNRKRY
ncbi:MAG: DUF4290 domain-containing protein [Bacteroidota bacterium]|nr:DUF4290 domain-containing protein [Bacteroidota bacterium]